MDFFLSGSEGVTGLCRWQLRRARSQFLFQSTKISSQEHWLQSFGKANWIVLYFSDSSSLGAPKAGALPETHHHFGGRRSVGAFSTSAFSLSQSHGEHGGVSEFQIFRVSAFSFCPPPRLRALPPPSRLRGRDDHAPLGHRCAAEKWVMQDDDHLQCAGAPGSPKCLRNSATRLKVCSREAFILSVESW